MKDIMGLVRSRYTCKDYDPKKKIPKETIKKIEEILVNIPSSSNTQTNRFLIIGAADLKEKVASFCWEANYKRVVQASHLVVFCGMNAYSEAHFSQVYHQEKTDGRFNNTKQEEDYFKIRRTELYLSLPYDQQLALIDAQVNIALGFFLLAVEGLGVNATPIGGFVRGQVDQFFNLFEKGWHSVYLVALGYSGKNDFNAALTKSRLRTKDIIQILD
ncbi:MAG: nitroreductase family protein [Neisseriaceae bacterium]